MDQREKKRIAREQIALKYFRLRSEARQDRREAARKEEEAKELLKDNVWLGNVVGELRKVPEEKQAPAPAAPSSSQSSSSASSASSASLSSSSSAPTTRLKIPKKAKLHPPPETSQTRLEKKLKEGEKKEADLALQKKKDDDAATGH